MADHDNTQSTTTATQPVDPNNVRDPNSKSAAKKEAKRLEREAKLAAKAAKAPPPGAASADGKKPKAEKKEKEIEPEFVNTTPKGAKKDLSEAMAAGYNPLAVEAAWYDWWVGQGFFKPEYTLPSLRGQDSKEQETFVIPSPPPNVTGSLHIGHALTVAIQDGLIRWNRMLGKKTLFAPGFDHAGISTQSVVEKRLFKAEGKTRHDLGRAKFLDTVMDWKNDYQGRITNQLHRLGGSYDWDRVAFTMDEKLSKAVIETFCRLHEDGILYRANRLVNWCVKLNTTLSNLEVDQKELEGRTLLSVPGYDPKEKFEFGVLTSFAYEVIGSDERLVIATTRPETMLGDTAVAVHPDDPRYKHLHGKFLKHPFVPERRVPVITDSIIVDMEFGTGAVKITPAHDQNDYEVGKRHNLEFINILNDDGTLNANAGPKFQGMKRFHARVEVVKALKELGLYIETKDNKMAIPICSKSGDVIEPILKPQWWVDCRPLADEAIRRTRLGELEINPKQSENEWYRWLDGIQDWCISRQLWWGHRCPAYFVRIEGEERDVNDGSHWVVGRTKEEANERAEKMAAGRKFELVQDEDVLDTWFSSGLWPFSIMGWPDKTADLKDFYPSSLLETGWDILFFWVARMVLLGLHLTGEMPFKEVYCHAMIRDAHGRKMSKSLGNVIDPLDVIQGLPLEALHQKLYEGNLDEKEIVKAKAGQKKDFPKGIPQCGTDALRFALCAYSGGGRDINLEILRVEGYRKFCNKIFNATKFAMLKLDEEFVPQPSAKPTGNESLVEKWILHKLNIAATEINASLAERNFMAATNSAYNFWLYELCDVYIEAMKPMTDELAPIATRKSAQQTLYTCLDNGLCLLHPFMPFVTEELWQRLPRRPNDPTPSIMVSAFPVNDSAFVFEDADKQFDLVFTTLKAARSLAASYTLQSDIQFFIQVWTEQEEQLFVPQVPTIVALSKGCKSAKVVRNLAEIPAGCGSAVVTPSIIVHTLVRGLVDLDNEIAKCDKKLDFAHLNLQKIIKVESQPEYEGTVPANVRTVNTDKRKTLEAEIATLETSKNMFVQLK
ncbi:tRNA synthetases class I-domain-containing protein [Flammula alnicola]|nr:tRNA synthetases class I-domain-containing protein [Flammula alnicola]